MGVFIEGWIYCVHRVIKSQLNLKKEKERKKKLIFFYLFIGLFFKIGGIISMVNKNGDKRKKIRLCREIHCLIVGQISGIYQLLKVWSPCGNFLNQISTYYYDWGSYQGLTLDMTLYILSDFYCWAKLIMIMRYIIDWWLW